MKEQLKLKQKIKCAVLLAAAIFSVNCISRKSKDSTSVSSPDKQSSSAITISAADLYDAYKKDAAAADARFAGKTVAVSGEIYLATEKSITGEPVAAFKADNKDGVSCKFPEAQKAAVGKLREGQTATFDCEVKGAIALKSFYGVALQNCEIKSADDSANNQSSSAAGETTLSKDADDVSSRPSGDSGKTISGGVLNDKAVSLVQPTYPAAARAVRASGKVIVQITVDETGKVISADAASGHPLLKAAAVKAAFASLFAPQMLAGKAVKVSGMLVYNFEL